MPHMPDPVLDALSEKDLLFVCLYGEVRGESSDGQTAVACVIRNRVLDPQQRFGKGWKGVILKWAAFSCLWPELGGQDFEATKRAALTIDEMRKALKSLSTISDGVYSGTIRDITKMATHYYAPPRWALDATPCGQYGRHLLFKDVN